MMYQTSSSGFCQLLQHHTKVLWNFQLGLDSLIGFPISGIPIRFASVFFDGAYDVYLQIIWGFGSPYCYLMLRNFRRDINYLP